jgi:hypothetical protein
VIGWDGMDWIDLAQDRDQWRPLANAMMNFWVPYSAGKFFNSCTIGRFSRRIQLHEVHYNIIVFVKDCKGIIALLQLQLCQYIF